MSCGSHRPCRLPEDRGNKRAPQRTTSTRMGPHSCSMEGPPVPECPALTELHGSTATKPTCCSACGVTTKVHVPPSHSSIWLHLRQCMLLNVHILLAPARLIIAGKQPCARWLQCRVSRSLQRRCKCMPSEGGPQPQVLRLTYLHF